MVSDKELKDEAGICEFEGSMKAASVYRELLAARKLISHLKSSTKNNYEPGRDETFRQLMLDYDRTLI